MYFLTLLKRNEFTSVMYDIFSLNKTSYFLSKFLLFDG